MIWTYTRTYCKQYRVITDSLSRWAYITGNLPINASSVYLFRHSIQSSKNVLQLFSLFSVDRLFTLTVSFGSNPALTSLLPMSGPVRTLNSSIGQTTPVQHCFIDRKRKEQRRYTKKPPDQAPIRRVWYDGLAIPLMIFDP